MIADLILFAYLSWNARSDLRSRTVSRARIFGVGGLFLGALQIFFAFQGDMGNLYDIYGWIAVVLTLCWGRGFGPKLLVVLFLFHPMPFLLSQPAYWCRKQMMQPNDLWLLSGIAAAFPWPAMVLVLLGLILWQEWWQLRRLDSIIPAVPGMVLGLAVYLCVIIY